MRTVEQLLVDLEYIYKLADSYIKFAKPYAPPYPTEPLPELKTIMKHIADMKAVRTEGIEGALFFINWLLDEGYADNIQGINRLTEDELSVLMNLFVFEMIYRDIIDEEEELHKAVKRYLMLGV